jgi:hypothetical protein
VEYDLSVITQGKEGETMSSFKGAHCLQDIIFQCTVSPIISWSKTIEA